MRGSSVHDLRKQTNGKRPKLCKDVPSIWLECLNVKLLKLWTMVTECQCNTCHVSIPFRFEFSRPTLSHPDKCPGGGGQTQNLATDQLTNPIGQE